jgi:hypothetical protein
MEHAPQHARGEDTRSLCRIDKLLSRRSPRSVISRHPALGRECEHI